MARDIKYDVCEKYSKHAFIYFIINSLVSYSMSLMQKKIRNNHGDKIFENFIKKLITNKKIIDGFRQYKPSKQESRWIPKSFFNQIYSFNKICL